MLQWRVMNRVASLATAEPVCVTGASGFIAAHIVRDLLAAGYRVRGTVRRLDRASALAPLRAFPGAGERLELVAANLLDAGAFDAAVAGAEFVIHTASPYLLDVRDPARDLVAPAVEGTRNVLLACTRAGSVKRVVLTSSMAAMTDEPENDHVLTEADWNEKSSLTRNPYYYSKTQAEREAWRIVTEDRPGFDLVVINPFAVIGPALTPGLNVSNRIIADQLKGIYPAIMRFAWGFVDVRDVAQAHILAMATPAASGRYLCANATMTMRELGELLRQNGYSPYPLPRLSLDSPVGDWLVRLLSYTKPSGLGSYLRTHVGRTPRFDATKIRRELGLTFRPLAATILETAADLVGWGHVPAAG